MTPAFLLKGNLLFIFTPFFLVKSTFVYYNRLIKTKWGFGGIAYAGERIYSKQL